MQLHDVLWLHATLPPRLQPAKSPCHGNGLGKPASSCSVKARSVKSASSAKKLVLARLQQNHICRGFRGCRNLLETYTGLAHRLKHCNNEAGLFRKKHQAVPILHRHALVWCGCRCLNECASIGSLHDHDSAFWTFGLRQSIENHSLGENHALLEDEDRANNHGMIVIHSSVQGRPLTSSTTSRFKVFSDMPRAVARCIHVYTCTFESLCACTHEHAHT